MNDCFAALDRAFPGKKLSELFLRNERSPTQRTRLNIDEGATKERGVDCQIGRLNSSLRRSTPSWSDNCLGKQREEQSRTDEGAFVISCADDDAEIRPK